MNSMRFEEDSPLPKGRSRWSPLISLLFISLAIRLALSPILFNTFDRRDYISVAHKTLRYGIGQYYYPMSNYKGNRGVPLPYPPVQIYFYAVAGMIYSEMDPAFYHIEFWRDLPFESLTVNYLIKLPLFLFELLLAAVIFFWVRKRLGEKRALVCAALYALNPAVLYDGAIWAQPDSIHSAFLALAIIFLLERRPAVCLSVLALALLAKPQPVALVPVVSLLVIAGSTARQTLTAIAAACISSVLVLLPLLAHGIDPIRKMLEVMSGVNPYVSANAHNIWWLLLSPAGMNPGRLLDSTTAFAGVSYLILSLLMVSIPYAVVSFKMVRLSPERWSAEPFAYLGFLFFVFAVRMHENHSIQVLPLLLLTGLVLSHQKVVFGLITVQILANMVLHSAEIVGQSPGAFTRSMQILNSALAVAVFIYWSIKLHRELSLFAGGEQLSATGP